MSTCVLACGAHTSSQGLDLIPLIMTPPNCIDIVRFRVHTPHSFVLPQSTQQWGKRPLHIKGRLFLISTSSCASLGDVRFHGLQNPLLGHYNLVYCCYYLWVLLHFLVLFMGLTVLFQLTFTSIYSTFSKKISVLTK